MDNNEMAYFFNKKPEILYSTTVLDKARGIPDNRVFPVSTLINGYNIPGLFVICDAKMWKFFKMHKHPVKPDMTFGMTNLEGGAYAMELVLYFDKISFLNRKKVMRLQLNPGHSLTRYYLKSALKHRVISFHFYSKDNHETIETITNLDKEDLEWVTRNYKLAMGIRSNIGYRNLVDKVVKEPLNRGKERYFKFYSAVGEEMLVENAKQYSPRKID